MFNCLLIAIFLTLFAAISWKNINWGIFLIAALLPAYLIRFTIFGLPATLLEGMIWLLFIVWLIKIKQQNNLTLNPIQWIKNTIRDTRYAIRDQQNPIPQSFRLPIVLLLIASAFSVFVSPDFNAAAGIWKAYFVEALMFFIIFIYTIKTTDGIKKVIRSLGLTVIAIGVFAVIQKLTGALIPNPFWANEATRRITTFFGYPNANALFVLPIIFLTLGNLLTDKKSVIQSFNLLVIILGTITIIWTQSTGGLLALIFGFICLLIFYKKTRWLALSIILLALIGSLFSPTVINKIQNQYIAVSEVRLSQSPSDLQIRVQMWRETLAMLKDTPIFGPGLAGYQTLIAPYHVNQHLEIFLYPHNFFLNFWSETGLLGLVSIVWILIVFFYSSFINHRSSLIDSKNKILTLIACSSMIALLIYGLVDVPYFKNDLAILFWIIIGVVIILYNQNINSRNNQQETKKFQIPNNKF